MKVTERRVLVKVSERSHSSQFCVLFEPETTIFNSIGIYSFLKLVCFVARCRHILVSASCVKLLNSRWTRVIGRLRGCACRHGFTCFIFISLPFMAYFSVWEVDGLVAWQKVLFIELFANELEFYMQKYGYWSC